MSDDTHRLVRRAWEYAKWFHMLCDNPMTRLGDVREAMREIVGFCEWMDSILDDERTRNMATMAALRMAIETKYGPAEVNLNVLSDVQDVLMALVANGDFADER